MEMSKSLKVKDLSDKKIPSREELSSILGDSFSGQITAYKIEEECTKFHDILFYERVIFTRNYKVEQTKEDDLKTEIMSMERCGSMDDVVIDYLHYLISSEGYEYVIEV